MSEPTTLEPSLSGYVRTMQRLSAYADAVAPCLTEQPSAIPVYVESTILLVVARLEHFFTSLLCSALQQREQAVRDYFCKHGSDEERCVALSCDRPRLVQMVRRRITFKDDGKRLNAVFSMIFDFEPWPNSKLRDDILDLVLLRNIFVHEGEKVLDGHAKQARRQNLFSEKRYGEFAVHTVDYANALVLLQDVLRQLPTHFEYVRGELLKRDEWTYHSKI